MRVSRRLSIVAFLLALAAGLLPAAFGAAIVSAGSATVTAGDVFSVPVSVGQVSGLYSFQFDLSFNPAVLQLQSITEGRFLPGAGTTFFIPGTIDNVSGQASFTADTLVGPIPAASGNGTLAIFQFEAIAFGASPLILSNVTLLNSELSDIPFTTTNGLVSVPEPGPLLCVTTVLTLFAVKLRRRLH